MPATTKKAVSTRNVTFNFAVVGSSPSKKTVRAGTTVKDIIQKYNLGGLRMSVNGASAYEEYALRNGDNFMAVPQVKGGC